MKSGFITIMGRPNAGKSTLLNCILGEKIAITTHKAQTTRNAILGIYNDENIQIVFVDTPGIHEANTVLGQYMNKEAFSQVDGADLILYIIDGKKGLQSEDIDTLNKISKYKVPIVLVVNKTDEIEKNMLFSRLTYANDKYNFDEIIPISALKKDNIDELLRICSIYLKDDVQYFTNGEKTNVDKKYMIAEIIREKVIINTDKEIPHLVSCIVDTIEEKTSKVYIQANIICNKETHKAIIIGKAGSMLKKINSQACVDIYNIFNKKIYLSIFVKVEEDWINSENKLFDLGYFKDKNER